MPKTAPVVSAHKEIATSFLQLAASGEARRAFDRYASPGLIHHNPHFPGDPTSLAAAMDENAAQHPDKVLDLKRVIEEGDLVAVHSRVRLDPDSSDIAVVHIFRFEEDRVAELWDIAQPVPEGSPNAKGMF